MRIVALRALGLGDLLTGVPALKALRDHHPDHELVLATTPAMVALGRLLPGVDDVVAVDELDPLPPVLTRPDVAVNLHGSGPQSHQLLAALRPGQLVAFDRPDVPATTGPRWDDDEHEVARWCRLLAAFGIPADPGRLDVPVPSGAAPAGAVGATIVHPGAKARSRRWPWRRFAAVARHEHDAGRPVVVTGTADERPLAQRVAAEAGLPPDAVLAGRTDVVELLQVVAAARRVVCGDTGVAHLATATATPSVVLFGPTPPAHWGPPVDRARHRVLWRGQRGDPLSDQPFAALDDIGVHEVVDALATLPDRPSPHTV